MCNDARVLQTQFLHNIPGEETCKIQLVSKPGAKPGRQIARSAEPRINVNLSSISNTSTSKLLCRIEA